MEMSKPVSTLMQKQRLPEQHPDQLAVNQFEYKEAIGRLQYVATISRPDISYAWRKLTRYAKKTWLIYWVRVKRIVRYLRGTTMMRLWLLNECNQNSLVCYADGDYAGNSDDCKFSSGTLIKYWDCTLH